LVEEQASGECEMTQIEAIYDDGVFKPLGDVALTENQRVTLAVQPTETGDTLAWLTRLQSFLPDFIAIHGCLRESTPDIAEERIRDA
jgi:predicted DNA-binding antitoxin AbrB/MazE fold protein